MAFGQLDKLIDFRFFHKHHDGFEYKMDWLGKIILRFDLKG